MDVFKNELCSEIIYTSARITNSEKFRYLHSKKTVDKLLLHSTKRHLTKFRIVALNLAKSMHS